MLMEENTQLTEDQLHMPNAAAPQEQYRQKAARRVDRQKYGDNLEGALGRWCPLCRRCHLDPDDHYICQHGIYPANSCLDCEQEIALEADEAPDTNGAAPQKDTRRICCSYCSDLYPFSELTEGLICRKCEESRADTAPKGRHLSARNIPSQSLPDCEQEIALVND
jgi:hypothetical protein